MFDNETYSFLYGLFYKIQPFLTVWYLYLFFWKLYPKMAKASLMSIQSRRSSSQEEPTQQDILGYLALSQVVTAWLISNFKRKS